MPPRPLLVGQAPGRRGDGEPLSGDAGRRLSALCGLSLEEYLARFERVNVLPEYPAGGRFPLMRVTVAARNRIVPLLPWRRTVILGRETALAVERALLMTGHLTARDLSFTFFVWHHVRPLAEGWGLITAAVAPHPSGRSRWWNDPENVAQARAFFSAFAADAASK